MSLIALILCIANSLRHSLQQCCKVNTFFERFLQDEYISCKILSRILQEMHLNARSCKKCIFSHLGKWLKVILTSCRWSNISEKYFQWSFLIPTVVSLFSLSKLGLGWFPRITNSFCVQNKWSRKTILKILSQMNDRIFMLNKLFQLKTPVVFQEKLSIFSKFQMALITNALRRD